MIRFPLHKAARILKWLFVAALVAPILLAAAIHLDQYWLRLRAERLQSEIRSLELRKSTYADARKVIDRWWSDAGQLGPCRPDWCDVEIALNRNIGRRMERLWEHPLLIKAYFWLGGRPAEATALIRIRNNILVGKEIEAHVAGKCVKDQNGLPFCVGMIGMVGTEGHRDFSSYVSSLHPEYDFWMPGGCEICVLAEVAFTAYADPADVRRLTDLNFACITSWHPCETQQDILPAWKERLSEKTAIEERAGFCTPAMIRVFSRERRKIPLARVTGLKHTNDISEVTVTMENEPDADARSGLDRPDWKEPIEYSYALPAPSPLRIGSRVLALANACMPVPATDENVAVAQQGVSEAAIDPPLPTVFPADIHLHKIDVH